MDANRVIKEQFNRGAQNFDNWSVTHNEKMMLGLVDFCELAPDDLLLDVACGTGGFSLFAAGLVHSVKGIDISEGMIEIARKNAVKMNLQNVSFDCRDVENIDLGNALFSVVVSRSAFHHMKNYQQVFSEMVRYGQPGGRICIQDIMAYGDDRLDGYFDEMESLIDMSHCKTYSKREFFNLFTQKGVKLSGIFESESQLDFYDYIEHTVQNENVFKKITQLLQIGLEDSKITSCFFKLDGRLVWKRKVCTIIGQRV